MVDQLKDLQGNTVNTTVLTKEIATVNVLGVRQPWYNSIANVLSPQRLAQVLAAVDQNEILEYLTLAMELEERDLHYSSVLRTRKLAVAGLSVVVEAASDDAEDVKIAEEVQDLMKDEECANLIADLLDAIGKGFAVSEIMWDRSEAVWRPSCYKWRDQRHFMFDRMTGMELRLRDEVDLAYGVELAPFKFVQHRPNIKTGLPIRGGLARLAVVAFMFKSYSIKNWQAFAEVFGMPLRVGKYGDTASPEQKAALLNAVANIGTDAAAIIPESMIIEFVNATSSAAGGGGDKLFQGLADWWDSQVSKGVLGQTMTTDNGSSLSQAKVHNEVREDIKMSDAKQLATTLRRDLVKPYIDLNYGVRKDREYPIIRLVTEEREDLESLATALPPFIQLGLRVEESVIRDKFALPEPAPDALLLQPKEIVSATGIKNDVQQKAGMMTAQDHEKLPQDATNPNQDPNAPLKPGQPKEQPANYDKSLQQAAQQILREVVGGRELTPDQRRILALAAQMPDDEIDRIANTLDGWKKVLKPATDPIVELARTATSYDDFLKKLETLSVDTSALAQAIAIADFKARGLGDSQDSPRT